MIEMTPLLNEHIENPTDEQLLEVLNDPMNFYPFIPVQFKEIDSPYLHLYHYHDTDLIKIEFHNDAGFEADYCSFTGIKNKEIFSIPDGGGEDFDMYAYFFIPKEEAVEAIKDFMRTGKKSNKIQWLKPQFEDEPDNRKFVVGNRWGDKSYHDNAEELGLPELSEKILEGNSYDIKYNTRVFSNYLDLEYFPKSDRYKIWWYNYQRETDTDFYAFESLSPSIIIEQSKGEEREELLFNDFYLEKQLTLDILLHFIQTGQRTSKVKWLSQNSQFYPENKRFIIETESFGQYCDDISDVDLSRLKNTIRNELSVRIILNHSTHPKRLELFTFDEVDGYLIAYAVDYYPSDLILSRRKYYFAFNPIPSTGILPKTDSALHKQVKRLGLELAVPAFYDNMPISIEKALQITLLFINTGEVSDQVDWREEGKDIFPEGSTLSGFGGFIKGYDEDLPF